MLWLKGICPNMPTNFAFGGHVEMCGVPADPQFTTPVAHHQSKSSNGWAAPMKERMLETDLQIRVNPMLKALLKKADLVENVKTKLEIPIGCKAR